MAKKYVSLSKLSTFLDNLKNLFATKDTVESISTNVAYINTTDNETITDTETSSSSVTVDSYLSTTSTNPVQNKVVTKKINEISQAVEDNAKAIKENAKIDVTAEVGQTIVVEEVDANGKPTKWKAADYQPRTHWSETAAILPETTVEIDPDEGIGTIPVDFVLEVGEPYTIKYNGVEYADCVGVEENEGVIVFGNLGALDGQFPVTEHPFVMVSAAEDMDGDGNIDYMVAVFPLDGAESVTLSIEETVVQRIPTKYLPDGLPYSETGIVEILPETTIAIYTEEGGGMYAEPIGLAAGENYTVRWNGVEYNCTAQDYYTDEGEGNSMKIGVCMGNIGLVTGGEDTGEPFAILEITNPEVAAETGVPVVIYALDGSESIVLSISCEGEIVHKIDNKYLPDGVGYEETVILLPTMTINELSNGLSTGGLFDIELPIQFIEGDTYIVSWNGAKYTCIATTWGNIVCLGNVGKITGSGDTGEPFFMASIEGLIRAQSLDDSTEVTVSIVHVNIHKIPLKYLPEGAGVPIVTAEDNGAFLRVVDGNWAISHIPNVEDGEF